MQYVEEDKKEGLTHTEMDLERKETVSFFTCIFKKNPACCYVFYLLSNEASFYIVYVHKHTQVALRIQSCIATLFLFIVG